MIELVTLGKTGLTVNKNGFGALPIQRIPKADAVALLRKAYENGVNYFDTARSYSDSEEKVGAAFSHIREKLIISTKTGAKTGEDFQRDLATSLRTLQTDYIDLYQFHNPPFCPRPGDGSGLYEAMLEAKAEGKVRHIGITNHRMAVAKEAVASCLYETLQFPFSYLSGEEELALVESCREADMGFIAMKGLAGGLIASGTAAYAYMRKFPHVEPIWGIQRERELEEFLACQQTPPELTPQLKERIAKDRAELSGDFCRGCGYCMPCPVGIEINSCARMSLMLRRAPEAVWLTEDWQKKMAMIEHCKHCNQCKSKCPYGLDTAALLAKNYEDYKTFLK